MKSLNYTCAICRGEFTGRPDEDVEREAAELFGMKPGDSGFDIACDDCFRKMFPEHALEYCEPEAKA